VVDGGDEPYQYPPIGPPDRQLLLSEQGFGQHGEHLIAAGPGLAGSGFKGRCGPSCDSSFL